MEDAFAAAPGRVELVVELIELAAAGEVQTWDLLKLAVQRLAELVGDTCVASLMTDDGRALHPLALADPDPDVVAGLGGLIGTRIRTDRGLTQRMLETRSAVRLEQTSADVVLAARPELAIHAKRLEIRSIVIAPMRARGRVVGQVALIRRRDRAPYTRADERLAQTVADVLGPGVVEPAGVPGSAPHARGADGRADRLTSREREILTLVALGHTNRAIAERLVLSVRTVEWHRSRLHWKLGVHGRAALAVQARELGLTS